MCEPSDDGCAAADKVRRAARKKPGGCPGAEAGSACRGCALRDLVRAARTDAVSGTAVAADASPARPGPQRV